MVFSWILFKCGGRAETEFPVEETEKRDTVVLMDTIVKLEPMAVGISRSENVTKRLPISTHDTIYKYFPRDSIDVEIPITQVEYRDSDYQAWVSGFEPKLDSLKIFKEQEFITIEKILREKPKRWHIGPTVGYGYTPGGFQPYVGVSLTYSLWGF